MAHDDWTADVHRTRVYVERDDETIPITIRSLLLTSEVRQPIAGVYKLCVTRRGGKDTYSIHMVANRVRSKWQQLELRPLDDPRFEVVERGLDLQQALEWLQRFVGSWRATKLLEQLS